MKTEWGSLQEQYTRKCMTVLMHNFLYYVLSDPTIEDHEYDKLFRDLEEFERKHPSLVHPKSPTQKVGSGNMIDYPRSILHLMKNHPKFEQQLAFKGLVWGWPRRG